MSRLTSGFNSGRVVMIKLEVLLLLANIFLLCHMTEASSRGGFGISGHLHWNDAKGIAFVEIQTSKYSSSDVQELSESRSVELTKDVTLVYGEEAQSRARLVNPITKVVDCLNNAPSGSTHALIADDPPPDPTPSTPPAGATGAASQILLLLQQSLIPTIGLLRYILTD